MTESPTKKFKNGDQLVATISSLAPGGEGVCRDFGAPVFVSRTAPGDVVKVQLFDVRKDFAKAQAIELIQPAPERTEPPCKIFKVCGGCQWQHMTYAGQLAAKTDIVRQAIKHTGKLDPNLVLPIIGCEEPLYYRNKVQFPVQQVRSTGRILAGYYKQGSHELVNIKHCPIQPEPLDRMLAAVKDAIESVRLSIYDEHKHAGLLRHIAARYSFAHDHILLTLVVNAPPSEFGALKKRLESLASIVMQTVPEVQGVSVNFQNQPGNRIMGDVTTWVAGETHIIERLNSRVVDAPQRLAEGISFRLSPSSFFQVNSKQAAVLLDEVLKAVTHGGVPGSRLPMVIDAYAGVGTMALWLSEISDWLVAIEEVHAAVEDGKVNMQLNKLENIEFIEGKVEAVIPSLLSRNLQADAVVVDPPRKGVERSGLESIIKLGAKRIVYVSCNPVTLARDLKILEESGYKTQQIQPVDMFPQTFHVETVTILDRSV